jgi:YcxB-like protein
VIDTVSLSWQPERADLVDGMRRPARRHRILWSVVALIGAVALVTGIVGGDPVGVAVGVVALAFAAPWVLAPRQLLAAICWRRMRYLRDPAKAEVTAAGITSMVAIATTTIPWTSIESVEESDRAFTVLIAGDRRGMFLMLPKRALPADEVPALRTLLETHATAPGR